MNAGEYIGKDGRKYRWMQFEEEGYHPVRGDGSARYFPAEIPREDCEEACKQLLALIASEQEEWVELPAPDATAPYIRVSRDGERAQQKCGGSWQDYRAWWIKAAYRKGPEAGRQEHDGLEAEVKRLRAVVEIRDVRCMDEIRDALKPARELVEAVKGARELEPGSYVRCFPYRDDWQRIKRLAEEVEL